MNYVILAGNLTKDPELKTLPSGTSVAKLRMAVNETRKDAQGNKVESVVYADVEAWGATAEACARSLAKGSPVLVEGRLRTDSWKTKEGQNRSRLLVRANRVDLLDGRRKGGAGVPGDSAEPGPPFDDGAPGEDETPS